MIETPKLWWLVLNVNNISFPNLSMRKPRRPEITIYWFNVSMLFGFSFIYVLFWCHGLLSLFLVGQNRVRWWIKSASRNSICGVNQSIIPCPSENRIKDVWLAKPPGFHRSQDLPWPRSWLCCVVPKKPPWGPGLSYVWPVYNQWALDLAEEANHSCCHPQSGDHSGIWWSEMWLWFNLGVTGSVLVYILVSSYVKWCEFI